MKYSKFELARRLRSLTEKPRDGKEKTIMQQAKEMGIPYQTFRNYIYLDGEYVKDKYKLSECSARNLVLIADYYGVSVDYLLGRTDNKPLINAELQELCNKTGLNSETIEHLQRLNDQFKTIEIQSNAGTFTPLIENGRPNPWKENLQKLLNAIIMSIQIEHLEELHRFLTITEKRKIYDELLLKSFCDIHGISCTEDDIKLHGEDIFHKRKLEKAYQLRDEYQKFKKLLHDLPELIERGGDADLIEDIGSAKYKISTYYDQRYLKELSQYMERQVYNSDFRVEIKKRYSRTVNEYIKNSYCFLKAMQDYKERLEAEGECNGEHNTKKEQKG